MTRFDKTMIGLKSLLALMALSGSVAAQDWDTSAVMRAIESPGHEALMAQVRSSDTKLALFETDGCSGGLSEAWRVVANQFPDFEQAHQSLPPWENCCVIHDKTYHNAGGALDAGKSFEARLMTDVALKTCVTSAGKARIEALADAYQVSPNQIERAYRTVAEAMFLAVRIGGAPCSGLPWRWGYGYPSCSALTNVFE